MPEMTPLEAAEKLESLIDYAGDTLDDALEFDLRSVVNTAASYLRKIAAGEYKQVVHGHVALKHRYMGGYEYTHCPECGTEIEVKHPAELDEPYCSVCGAQLAESSQGVCPRCGAVLNGKDDSHV